MEALLTQTDILDISEDAKSHILSKYQGIRLLAKDNYSNNTIIRVSDLNNLILIKGNEYTGFKHIRLRHDFFSTYPKWEKDGSLNNPTKFPTDIIPLYYCNIADHIYKEENRTASKNDFEVYKGKHEFKGTAETYVLVMYPGSKVIHTLFPVNNKLKKPKTKSLKLARGQVFIEYEKSSRYIHIPYTDSKNVQRYNITIAQLLDQNIEGISIYAIDMDKKFKQYFIFQKEITVLEPPVKHELIYQNADLRVLEKIIIEIDKHHQKGTIPPYKIIHEK